jgi:hypothetical protein
MNWNILKSLHEIYELGKTRSRTTIINDPYIAYLIKVTKEVAEEGPYLVAGNGFRSFYEQSHRVNYSNYLDFLKRNDLLKPQTRYCESDIKILIDIEERMVTGDLIPLCEQITRSNETLRGISLMFFKNEKYLEGRPSLIAALKQILNITSFADDRDQQYKYVLECNNPRYIVLCENIHFLKKPTMPRQHSIELWYAGGKNIDKLNYIDTRGLPIYYSCDWDYDGLLIYGLVKQKIPSIMLLFPTGELRNIISTEHKSHWHFSDTPTLLSGFNSTLFSNSERELIENLITSDSWIIEESNDLIEMVNAIN